VAGLVDGSAEPSRLVVTGRADPGAGVLLGAVALAFFAYLGFEDMVHLSEEVHDPRRSFPRALFGGLAAVGVVYLGVTVAASVLVEPRLLARSSTPLLTALEQGPLAVPGEVFAVIAIVAVTNTALLALTTASRQVYGLAETGSVPAVLGWVGWRRTPTVAIVLVAAVVGTLAVTGEVRALADTTVVLLLGVFTVVNATVLALRPAARRTTPEARRVPAVVPALGAVASAVLALDTLARGGAGLWLRLAALLGLGAVLYGASRVASGGRSDSEGSSRSRWSRK
jgi:amino acid transporter